MKIAIRTTALIFSLLTGTVVADPVINAPCRVFCFRITDIRADKNDTELNRFHVEFEVLNWANTFAGGLNLNLAAASSSGVEFAPDTYFNLNGVDPDGRPIHPEDTNGDGVVNATDMEDTIIINGQLDDGEDKNNNSRLDNDPILGNLNRNNSCILTNQTATKMEWQLGDAIPFINLVDAGNNGGCARCITSLPRTPTGVTVDPLTGAVTPLEAVDNGDNVQDGFVMTIDGFDVGSTAHINWFLTGAGNATVPFEPGMPDGCRVRNVQNVPLGAPIGAAGQGNPYGFGLISLTRVDDDPFQKLPKPWFRGQTGFLQTATEFFGGVNIVPDPAVFAMEFSPGLTAAFKNPSDNSEDVPTNAVVDPSVKGDPHIKTWSGEMYDFHGGCDLVLAHIPEYANGLGMDVHIRTTIEKWWSYVDSAAIRIGEDTIEVHGGHEDSWFWINGKPNAEKMEHGKVHKATIGGFKTRIQQESDKQRKVIIDLEDGDTIMIKAFGGIVRVDIRSARAEYLYSAVGLMGSFPTGKKVARDGKTVFDKDVIAFGKEWQVLPSDSQIFHSREGVQAPQECAMPTTTKKRRLGESGFTLEDSERACAHVSDEQDREACVSDVLATNSNDMAGAY